MPREERVVRLLADPIWIHRRVETLQLSVEGETRRKVSFDFTIPPHLRLVVWQRAHHNFTKDAERVIVPLCFMRKGTLVNLDTIDGSGSALPVLSLGENGELVKEGIVWLLRELSYSDESSKQLANDVIYSSIGGVEITEASREAEVNFHRKKLFTTLAKRELGEKIPIDEELLDKNDAHVYKFADWVMSKQEPAKGKQEPAKGKQEPAKGKQEPAKGKQEPAKGKREGFPNVLHLTASGSDASPEVPGTVSATMLLVLLAAMSEDYVFAVELPAAAAKHRMIVKISYASVATRVPPRFSWRRLMLTNTLRLALATSAASSTHIEIETTPSVLVSKICATWSGNLTPFRSVASATRRHHLSTSRRNVSVNPKTSLLLTVVPSRVGALTAAFVACLVNMMAQVLLVVLSLPAIAAARIRAGSTDKPKPAELAELLGPLRDTNSYSIGLAAISLAVALIVVVQFNDVERRALRIPRILIVAASITFSFSLIMLSFQAQWGTVWFFDWSLNRWAMLAISFILLVLASAAFFNAKPATSVVQMPKGKALEKPLGNDSRALLATESALFDGLNLTQVKSMSHEFRIWR